MKILTLNINPLTMNIKTYHILGMSCESCQKKISSALNNIEGINAQVNLSENAVEITSKGEINLEQLNSELQNAGNYILEDPDKPKNTAFIPPQERVSPSSVYYCPMECEGEKVYFTQGKRCPTCNMYLVPIEEKGSASIVQHSAESRKPKAENGYYCPMFCEGDKTYAENVGCPICGMDLVKISGDENDTEDETFKNLRNKFWISTLFTIPVFVLSMGGMFFEFPFSSKVSGILQLILTIPVVFYTGWFLFKRAWVSFKTWNLNMFSLIGLGASAAFLYSIFALFFPNLIPHEFLKNHHETPLYFEAVSVILTLVILGQMLEAKAHQKTGNAIKELMNLVPLEAHLIKDSTEKSIIATKWTLITQILLTIFILIVVS